MDNNFRVLEKLRSGYGTREDYIAFLQEKVDEPYASKKQNAKRYFDQCYSTAKKYEVKDANFIILLFMTAVLGTDGKASDLEVQLVREWGIEEGVALMSNFMDPQAGINRIWEFLGKLSVQEMDSFRMLAIYVVAIDGTITQDEQLFLKRLLTAK